MNEAQASDAVLLVRPASFGFHAEAAAVECLRQWAADDPDVAGRAAAEFDGLASAAGGRGGRGADPR